METLTGGLLDGAEDGVGLGAAVYVPHSMEQEQGHEVTKAKKSSAEYTALNEWQFKLLNEAQSVP